MLHTSTTGASRRMNVTPESDASKPAPARLNLPEAVELLVAHLKCTKEHARDLLERAVYGGSLRDVTSFDPLCAELDTDVTAWRDIDWVSGIVAIEPSWAGSPVQHSIHELGHGLGHAVLIDTPAGLDPKGIPVML